MRANPLRDDGEHTDRPIPPKGDSPEQKAERQRFWIERGNQKLAEAGMGHLHWQCVNGNYFIEERTETARRIEADRRIKDAVRAIGRAA